MTREWKAGDRIELELPMEPQRVTSDPRIQANTNLTALKYGPLVYNVEAADNQNIDRKLGDAALRTEWKPDLLGGVMVIQGKWADGSEFTAIPNYARMNRVGPPTCLPWGGRHRCRPRRAREEREREAPGRFQSLDLVPSRRSIPAFSRNRRCGPALRLEEQKSNG